jgi:hypothetical protein
MLLVREITAGLFEVDGRIELKRARGPLRTWGSALRLAAGVFQVG